MHLKNTILMATAVLALAACSPQPNSDDWQSNNPTRVCKNAQGIRVSDDKCRRPASGAGSAAAAWYFLGRGAYIPPVGSRFSSDTIGSNRPTPGTAYYVPTAKAPSHAVTRGGFGASSSAHSSSVGG